MGPPWGGASVSGLVSGKIRRISGTYESIPRIDVTGLGDAQRVYVPGLKDWGEITLEIVGGKDAGNSLPTSNVGTTGDVTITLHDGVTISFKAVVSSYDVNVAVGDAPTATVKLSILGPAGGGS